MFHQKYIYQLIHTSVKAPKAIYCFPNSYTQPHRPSSHINYGEDKRNGLNLLPQIRNLPILESVEEKF